MIRPRLLWEILLPYAAFVLLAAAASIGINEHLLRETIVEGEFERLETAARSVAIHDEFFRTPADKWRDDLQRIAEATGIRLTVIDGRGGALASTDALTRPFDRYDDRPDVRQARNEGVGKALPGEGQFAVTVAVHAKPGADRAPDSPARGDGPLLGFVRAEDRSGRVAAAKTRARRWTLGLSLAAGVVGLLWAGWTTARLAGPIESFVHAAKSVTGTDAAVPAAPLRLPSASLLMPLSSALDALAERLAGQVERLRRDNASLAGDSERLSAVLTGMAEGVLAVDRTERILFANPAASSLLDLADTRLVGRPVWEAVRLSAIQDIARQAREQGDVQQVEVEMPRTQTVLALRAGRLPGDPSPGVVLVMHDITELRRLENLRREFVGNVSHELKTPLAAIQAYTETLLSGGIDDQQNNRRFLQRIDEQAERLNHLILDLLRLARIEAGTDVFEITRLTAGQIIDASVEGHAAIARSKGVSLTTVPSAVPVRVHADRDGLLSILDNLLDNALNYTPAGGRVIVRWGRENDWAFFEVEDTGIGIPPEHLPRIFERFHRVDQARSREHGGTGLGLAIVKHLVQVFGGRVEVDSDVGRGSLFRVLLPPA